jgi:hypothetical protein
MRLFSAVILMLALPAGAAAQSSVSTLAPLPPLPPIGLPLPSITSPLAPIGFPPSSTDVARQIGTHARGDSRQGQGRAGDHPRFNPRSRFRSPSTFVYMVPMYGWGIQPPVVALPTAPAQYAYALPAKEERPAGILRLELDPPGAAIQVYVNGYFVGTPDEINRDLTLEAGPHRIEVRAAGYEAIAFDVRIVADRSITYRAALQRVAQEPKQVDPPVGAAAVAPTVAPTAAPSTFYFIPGCYIGNVPPEKLELPANCDMSRLITRKP